MICQSLALNFAGIHNLKFNAAVHEKFRKENITFLGSEFLLYKIISKPHFLCH